MDNAATSWPKPECVYKAVDHYQREIGVAAGRGSYRQAEAITRVVKQTRQLVADVIHAESYANIVFTSNCTDSLNLAIHGLLDPGDHVITSVAEHNSILRPLATLQDQGVACTYLPVSIEGTIDLDELKAAIQPTTKLIAITHASNVTGAVQPIADIAKLAHQHGAKVLVDAAQTIGHIPLDVRVGIDLLAAPGHKGLMGPLGLGFLYVSPKLESELRPTRQGGTGTESESVAQPNRAPAKFESGNLNVPGIIGLGAGIKFLNEQSAQADSESLEELTAMVLDGISSIDRVQTYSNANACGIVSFNIDGHDPREVSAMLDSIGQVEVRSGLHCAPWMHRALGTISIGGTVRASFGHFNTANDVNNLIKLIRMIATTDLM